MNILNELREQIGANEIRMLSSFLGENEESLSKSTDLSITAILQGLVNQVENGGGANGIMNVIRDGGHSGDIIDDLKGLFSNQDKTQLLVTIGNNINNHFFGKTTSAIGDKISEFGGIKKTSAASLFSLCAPLVLGFIGKQVKTSALSATDLGELLLGQKPTLQGYLPPAIFSLFGDKKTSFQQEEKITSSPVVASGVEEKVKPKAKTSSGNGANIFGIFAWLLLAALVFAAAYYSLRNKGSEEIASPINYQENAVSLDSSSSAGFQNDSFTVGDDVKTEAIAPSAKSDRSEQIAESIETTPSVINEKPAPTARPTSTVAQPTQSKPTSSNQSFNTYAPIKSQLSKAGTWSNFSQNNFKGRSAEISKSQELSELANMMKADSNKVLKIVGLGKSRQQEDRAYAIRGRLYDLGVPLSQLEIVAGPTSNDGSVIMKFD